VGDYLFFKHLGEEEQFLAVGYSSDRKPLFVVFTIRSNLIRPISARYMHKKEVLNHEKILFKMMSDEETESFLSADLSEYLTPENFKTNFTPVSFEFPAKDEMISIQLSPELFDAVKVASAKG
jgi:hypothetical protein